MCAEHVDDCGKNEVYDVIISGGGMVGSAMACSLGELRLPSHLTQFWFVTSVIIIQPYVKKSRVIRSCHRNLHLLSYVQRHKI